MKSRANVVITVLVGMALVAVFVLRGSPGTAPPPLGQERVPAAEARALRQLAAGFDRAAAPNPVPGECIAATFRVIDNLDPALAVGIFRSGHEYPALVRRQSRFAPGLDPERIGPALAIRLFDVAGAFIDEADADANAQDFVLGFRPAFPLADAAALADWFADGTQSRATGSAAGTSPARWWSMLPFRFGDHHAVKYAARPCAGTTNDRCYEFLIQFQNDPARMPIEDASVAWDEALSPFEPVAVLLLAPAGDEPVAGCDSLEFSPWQSLAVHAPLGGINRARRILDGVVPAAGEN